MKTTILLFSVLALLTTGCRRLTYQNCIDKYGASTKTDTVYAMHTDSVYVPADSASFQVPTDTTNLTQIIEKGPIRLMIRRTRKVTEVKANYLPHYIRRTFRTVVTINNRTFQKPQTGWRNAFWIVLLVALLGWLLVYFRR